MIPGREPVRVGAFRIERKLGGGAFKAVYEAVNEQPAANGWPERVALCVPRQQDHSAEVAMSYDSTTLTAEVETMKLTNAGLVSSWGPEIYRVLLKTRRPVTGGECTVTFKPSAA